MAARGRGARFAGLRAVGWNGVLGGFLPGGRLHHLRHGADRSPPSPTPPSCSAPRRFLAALLGRLVLGEPVRRFTWLAMAAAASASP